MLLLFHIDGKLIGTMCLYKMSFAFVIDLDGLVDKDVISHIAVFFIGCYVFYMEGYARDKDILCV